MEITQHRTPALGTKFVFHRLGRRAIRAQGVIAADPLHLRALRIHAQVAVLGADATITMVDGDRAQVGHLEAEAHGAAMAVGVVPSLRGGIALAEDGFDDGLGEDAVSAGGSVESLGGVHRGGAGMEYQKRKSRATVIRSGIF